MNKIEQLYEGKAKKVYSTEDPNVVIVSYKDDATAFDGLKKGTITGKGPSWRRPASPPTWWRSSASVRPP